jgi:hypothetical protein
MHDEPDDIDRSQHPDPLGLSLVPHQQLLDVLADEDVDGFDQRDRLVDGGHGRVDRHAIVRSVVKQDLRDQRLQVLLGRQAGTSLLMDWWLCRYSPDSSPD